MAQTRPTAMLITAIISTGKRSGCVYGYENQLVFLFLCSEVPTIVVCLYLSLLTLTQDFRHVRKAYPPGKNTGPVP